MNRTQIALWALRSAWLATPLLAGSNLTPALGLVPDRPRLIIEAALWVVWFIGLVAALTAHPLSLTVVRILAPATVGFGLLAGFHAGWGSAPATVVGYGFVLTMLALLPSVGDIMVNGSAYGSERRMALRTPAVAFIAPLPLGWLCIFAGLTVWAVFVARERYWPAALAAAIGAVAVWAAGRLLHQLARRWIVFVPAGFVIHDPFQLVDPVLMSRASIRRLGPAEVTDQGPATTGAISEEPHDHLAEVDLTAGSLGLALEVESSESVVFGLRRKGQIETKNSSKVVFSPTLPGALLSEARVRGIKIRGSSRVG